MRNRGIIFVSVAGSLFVMVATWVLLHQPVTRSSSTVLVEPTTTPLRDSIREPKAAKKKRPEKVVRSGRSQPNRTSASPNPSKSVQGLGNQRRAQSRSPAQKRKTPARKPAPSSAPQSPPSAPPAPTQTQPAVSVPLPSVCTQQIKVNC